MADEDLEALEVFFSTSNLCCGVHPVCKVFGKEVCIDCFRRIRTEIVILVLDCELSALGVIEWL